MTSLNTATPSVYQIPGGIFPGRMVRVQGVVCQGAERFAISLQCGPSVDRPCRDDVDVALHLSFRVPEKRVVRNHVAGAKWGPEEAAGPLPPSVAAGRMFETLILCKSDVFKVALNHIHFCDLAHRLPYQCVTHIAANGDVVLQTISFETTHISTTVLQPNYDQPVFGAPPPAYHEVNPIPSQVMTAASINCQDIQVSSSREHQLQLELMFYKFMEKTSEVQDWMQRQMIIASSEDYGHDLEEVDALMRECEDFLVQLQVDGGKIESVCKEGELLLGESVPESERVRMKVDDILGFWEAIKDVAVARKNALQKARRVHARSKNKRVTWAAEIDADIDNIREQHKNLSLDANKAWTTKTQGRATPTESPRHRNVHLGILNEDIIQPQERETSLKEDPLPSEVISTSNPSLRTRRQLVRHQSLVGDLQHNQRESLNRSTSCHDGIVRDTVSTKQEGDSLVPSASRVSNKMNMKKINRTSSFRVYLNEEVSLPLVDIKGYLERKQEADFQGKRASLRSWREFYVVLCKQLLCFFKDESDFRKGKSAAPPIVIRGARCSVADDYTKRAHVFRLSCVDGTEYLFVSASRALMMDWIQKLSEHALLLPAVLTADPEGTPLTEGTSPVQLRRRKNHVTQRADLTDVTDLSGLQLEEAPEDEENEKVGEEYLQVKLNLMSLLTRQHELSEDRILDKDAVLAAMTRQYALRQEIAICYENVSKFHQFSNTLLERPSTDKKQVTDEVEDIKEQYDTLETLSKQSEENLQQRFNYFKFKEECAEVKKWIEEQTTTATSEEFGQDLKHSESLLKDFEKFELQLLENVTYIETVLETADVEFLKTDIPQVEEFEREINLLRESWRNLNNKTGTRKEALREIHKFFSTAEETTTWVEQKTRCLEGNEAKGLYSSLTRRRQLDALNVELVDILKHHSKLVFEAERVGETFPDTCDHVIAKLEEVSDALQVLAAKAEAWKRHLESKKELPSIERDFRLGHQNSFKSLEKPTLKAKPVVPPRSSHANAGTALPRSKILGDKSLPLATSLDFGEPSTPRVDDEAMTECWNMMQVKALYDYMSNDVTMREGDTMFLLSKTNADWWLVLKGDGCQGHVPASYVQLIEPRIEASVPPTKRPPPPPPPRPLPRTGNKTQTQEDPMKSDRSRINITAYSFFADCDDMEKLIKEKGKILRKDHGEADDGRPNYERIMMTDLGAVAEKVKTLEGIVEMMSMARHGQASAARARLDQLRQQWEWLMTLKQQKEKECPTRRS